MSPQPSLPDRFRGAFTAIRGSIARKPMPWAIGALAAVLVLGSGGAVAVAAATAPTATESPVAAASPSASSTASAVAVVRVFITLPVWAAVSPFREKSISPVLAFIT